ncbi:MAG TPA: methyltransferase domain-containing protein [Roseiarcus sp.]|nr:methyltransferase domain-containing protein [Roseiarcus sp.]
MSDPDAVHAAAAAGFAAGAATYAAGRPDYPAEVEGWLSDDLHLGPGRAVLDLGAGTGKFLSRLRATGATLYAVEPVPAMLRALIAAGPDVVARSGTAERIPLPDASMDAIVCAQSFHWFASRAALAEMRRVLKVGGVLGLIWNVRDESVDWVAALTRIIAPYEGDAPRFSSGRWREVFPAQGFSPLTERRFAHAHVGPPERVIVDRVLSTSFIAALSAAEQEKIAARVREVVAATPALAGRAEVAFPYETCAFHCVRIG